MLTTNTAITHTLKNVSSLFFVCEQKCKSILYVVFTIWELFCLRPDFIKQYNNGYFNYIFGQSHQNPFGKSL